MVVLMGLMGLAFADPGVFAGSWTYAGGEQGKKAISDAVEDGAQRFNFAIRPIARSKITKACAMDETITISGDPGKVHMTYTGPNARSGGGPADGTQVSIRGSKVAYTVAGDTLTVNGTNEDGGKISVYRVTGDTMTVTHTVASSSLGDPALNWTLTYQRQ